MNTKDSDSARAESPRPARVNVLGVGISAVNMAQAVALIEEWIARRARTYISTCPVYTAMSCMDDVHVRRAVNGAGLVVPDGMPTVWILRLAGFSHVTRVYGPDLMAACCARGVDLGWRHYIYGGAEGVPELLTAKLQARFPGLAVAGGYSPPFRELTQEEDRTDVARINAARADIVWVGLGSPKQDVWMAEHRTRLDAPVLIGVGAAFDFYTGRVRQAPRWMQRSGLEWLFRLMQEPRRLWRRYLIHNPRFLFYLFLQFTGLRRYE